ncbi:MAG: alginate export family protein [Bacteroidetes bacterium]|nr:alginate export family protein [Bacteroidota bacterium]
MKTKLKGAVLTALIATTALTANAQMTLTGEIRPRFEYRHGFKALSDSAMDAAMFVSQRTRINFGYSNDNFKTKVVFQDVRIWGSQSQLNSTDGLTAIHEAWAEYNFSKKVAAKFGRQEIVYDDERIFGGLGWAQQGRKHDAALFKYNDSTFILHVGFAYNQDMEQFKTTKYTIASSYKAMQYLWLNKKWPKLELSYLALTNGQQSSVTNSVSRYSFMTGPHIQYKSGKLSLVGKGYYMGGMDVALNDMQAYLAGIDVSYSITPKVSATLGYELQSGQSQTDTTKAYKKINHSFNPLFGTNHAFNGYMDYFYVGNHINSVGLQDIWLRLKYKTEKWWITADAHMFNAAADILDTKEFAKSGKYTAMNANLGTELDVTFAYNLAPNVVLQGGYSQMFGTDSMKAIRGGKTNTPSNWAYLMLTFRPNFLK